MAHQRQTSRHLKEHLRNRHGSDAIRDDQNTKRSLAAGRPFDADSPYADEDAFYSESNTPRADWSPAHIENGIATGNNKTLQAPLSPPLTLPSGASTPNLSTTAQGNPIVTYPPEPPTWSNMPNKGQLAILASSRFVDFFQMAALQTVMVHQLKSFDHELPDTVISHQAGVLQGAFTAAQIVTSILWGRAADQPNVGRKLVLNIGLVGTGIGCIGVGFSTTYEQAVFWRVMSGAINGTVGAARVLVSERTPRPWHPRAFLLLPAAFNVANVLGPILSGLLVDPFNNMAHLFGPGSTFGGPEGLLWMQDYPYAAANLLCTVLLLGEALIVHYGVEETLKGKRPLNISKFFSIQAIRNFYIQVMNMKDQGYRVFRDTQRESLLTSHERGSLEMEGLSSSGEKELPVKVQRLPFGRIWTSNVLWTLVSIAIFDFHMGAFNNLWILFLATPRAFVPESEMLLEGALPPSQPQPRSVFKFAHGLAFPPPTIGFAMAIIGFIGVALQFLLYPWANSRFGLMNCFKWSLVGFPVAYILAPFIAQLPSSSPPPDPASGWAVWIGISFVLFLQVAARTFALPALIILANNCCPHPSVLGTIVGIGQACSATFRTFGPILAGSWYGLWYERGVVGVSWWIVAAVALVGCGVAYKVRNGTGQEIFLPGEEQEEKEEQTGGGSGDGR